MEIDFTSVRKVDCMGKITLETDFTSVRKMDCISIQSALLSSAQLKCIIYAISKNYSYDKAWSKHPYLRNVFVLFIDLGHFVIIKKGFSILLDADKSLPI